MQNHSITFLNFEEAIQIARAQPGTELVGLRFLPPHRDLGIYMISVDPDEPEEVNIAYEGGELFSGGGEEDFYDANDAPDEAKMLFYANTQSLGDGSPYIMGMTSEYVLSQLIPGLGENDGRKYRDHAHFMQVAGERFQEFWRQY